MQTFEVLHTGRSQNKMMGPFLCKAISTMPDNSYTVLMLIYGFMALEIFILVEDKGQGADRLEFIGTYIYQEFS